MERKVDNYEEKRRPNIQCDIKIQAWKDSWFLCMQTLNEFNCNNIRDYHIIIERWIPLINKAHGSPITKLHEYQPTFYYLDKAMGPKEILQAYFDVQTEEVGIPMYIIFNVYLFKKIYNQFCSIYAKNSQMNVDNDRGTVNLLASGGFNVHPSEHFKMSTTWHFLFILVNHLLAHIECFEKYDTASYNDHNIIKKSSFYKMYMYGRVNHSFTELNKG
ncbi:hypothetical protein NPIL_138451 [Nephila pilipes]|uniref:Uncharacterized protein n=1 Tax=Nephila pilipes TaxID=299642 RepID=A0A8X6QD94_NEPPI|nr:hypothetical protein NPIL_138451 [Nephila pilipes]